MTAAEIVRDQWGRPLITPPDGGKPIGYTRISTLAKALDDGAGLVKWGQAMTAIGLAIAAELAAEVAELVAASDDPYTEHKTRLISIAHAAQEAAGSTIKRELGTTLHDWSAQIDRGEGHMVPTELRPDLEAYVWSTADLPMLLIEQFVVVDEIEAAGTLDRLVMHNAMRQIADLKTGQNDPRFPMSVEMQVACYAHGDLYDLTTGVRTPLGASHTEGLLIHLPSGQATCRLYPLDLTRGWANIQLACAVRAARKASNRTLKETQR